jgi:hypothetical protein
MKTRKRIVPVFCASALTIAPACAWATDPPSDDGWRFSVMPYLWSAGIKGEAASGSDFDIGFDELLNNLNMAFMGYFEARKSKWSLAADAIYLNVGAGGGGSVAVRPPGSDFSVDVEADVKLRAWVWTLTGGYNLWQSERGTLDAIAGARYLEIDVFLDASERIRKLSELQLAGPTRTAFTTRDSRDATQKIGESGDVWDAVIGVRGDINLNDQWYVPYYLDVGTGDSDLTWQIAAGVGYKFNWGDVNILYRYMDWDFSSGGISTISTSAGRCWGPDCISERNQDSPALVSVLQAPARNEEQRHHGEPFWSCPDGVHGLLRHHEPNR